MKTQFGEGWGHEEELPCRVEGSEEVGSEKGHLRRKTCGVHVARPAGRQAKAGEA